MTQPCIGNILDTIGSTVVCIDQNLKICYVNSPAEILFGSSAGSLLGTLFSRLFSNLETNTLILKLQEFIVSPNTLTEHEANITLYTGKAFVADYTIYTLENDDGTVQPLVEIRPLEPQILIARAEQNQQHKLASQQLARGLAHEIRNPLGGIRGAAQLLEMEFTGTRCKEYTEVIISEVDRLQALVSNLLGPTSRLVKTPVNILEVLEHIRKLLLAANPGQFEIQRDYDPSIPELGADKNQLIQAFLNIAQNAAQALTEHGKIVFKTRIGHQITIGQIKHPLVVQVDIIDNGKGIPDELFDTIFLPMVTNKSDGSGLGLTIAQEIVSRHGGIIRSERKLDGSIFSTTLPLIKM